MAMALDNFIGKWQEETREGFDPLCAAAGLSAEKKELYRSAKTEIQYEREGDEWKIKVGFIGDPDTKVFRFRLGQPYESVNIDGTPLESIVHAVENRLVGKHIFKGNNSSKGQVMHIVRWIDQNGKMIVEIKIKDATMRAVYKRI